MTIKKLGHCCFVVGMDGKRIMVDPGFSTEKEQSKEFGINIILISHEHPNHFHLESIKKVLFNNPSAVVITNNSVGKFLDETGIKYEVLGNKIPKEIFGIELEAHDCRHQEIFKEMEQVQHTAYFIARKLFYPGDSFYNPRKLVEILALPVAGPWANVKEATEYALEIKPRICFPIHDGMLRSFGLEHKVPKLVLSKAGILFKSFEESYEEKF
jgi:L-ascorbate metabolism protein UlaG (beta-lactamase superfamily)